jgi:hypothetical protein
MKLFMIPIMLACLSPRFASAGQIIAGTAEDKMFQRITAETNPDAKLQTLMDFEKQFPQSKVLPDVFLMIIDLHRQKGDRLKVLEYGEKVLKLDARNVTAMMVLARNYAIEGNNVDRAVMLAEQAVDQIGKMKAEAVPTQYTAAQWKDYLQSTEAAAKSILDYAKSIRGHRSPD